MPPKKANIGRKSLTQRWRQQTTKRNRDYISTYRDNEWTRQTARRQQEAVKDNIRQHMEERRKVSRYRSVEVSRFARQRYLSAKQQQCLQEQKIQDERDAEVRKEFRARLTACHAGDIRDPETDYWCDNELIEAGEAFYESMIHGPWEQCIVCQESYPFQSIGPRSKKCQQCSKSDIFRKNNNLTPERCPPCLADLTQVELSCIARNCPVLQIYRRGQSKGTRGHVISVWQDVKAFASELPPKVKDLPYLLVKNPRESVTDPYFKVRRHRIAEALKWLKANNPYFKDIIISHNNLQEYPEDNILQNLGSLDPEYYNIPVEAPSAVGPIPEMSADKSAPQDQPTTSTVDLSVEHQDALKRFKDAMQPDPQLDQGRTGRKVDQVTLGGEEDVQHIEVDSTDDERVVAEGLELNRSFHPTEVAADEMEWPKRGSIVSEFTPGYFSMMFPDLFPCNIVREGDGEGMGLDDRYETGDITEPREGRNPSRAEYFKHLLRYDRRFSSHHCFCFVANNLLRRHLALSKGSVFAKNCAEHLTVAELKAALDDGKSRVFNKLMYFGPPIPGTMQYMRYHSDLSRSYLQWLRIKSDDKQMFNFFLTLSAADLHWADLHAILPGNEEYLGKIPLDREIQEEERHSFINRKQDHLLRIRNIKDNQDIVDWFLYYRVQSFLTHVLKPMGVQEYIVRYEAQHRGTMHAHILIHVEDGPSAIDLKNAYSDLDTEDDGLPSARNAAIREARNKVSDFTKMLGVSAVHPQPDVTQWRPPEGLAAQEPSDNVLREPFLDIPFCDENAYRSRYERLVNRLMLHQCRSGYCLQERKKDKQTGQLLCRFGFEKNYFGFEPVMDDDGNHIKNFERSQVQCPEPAKAEVKEGDLHILRNHKRLVSHIPELLSIWQANIECRPVRSYMQVIKYLLKYMMKEEPNSSTFNAITRAAIQEVEPDDPVKKVFQKVLMKTVGQHDMSKQEVLHLLNGLPFVYYPIKFVNVNVMGARRIDDDLQDDGNANRQVKVRRNVADQYFARDKDPAYKKACEKYLSVEGTSSALSYEKNPKDISLYEFAYRYGANWKRSSEEKVPHITPNFGRIPKRSGDERRYRMFLLTTLLCHSPGAKFEDLDLFSNGELEVDCRALCESDHCPQLIKEQFQESQQDDTEDIEGREDEEFNNPRGSLEDLIIEPEYPDQGYEQSEVWERLLFTIQQTEDALLDGDEYYDDADFQNADVDWEADARQLGITTEDDFKEIGSWLNDKIQTFKILRDLTSAGGLPSDLNTKQLKAFAILKDFLIKAETEGIHNVPQLLLNISGGPGTGKTFFLNTIRKWAQGHIKRYGDGFILTAAPTGAAAFLIGGSTIHSLLYLPVNLRQNQTMHALDASRLKTIQDRFKDVSLLVIDEKSMIGQKTFFMISERLKECRPQTQHLPFGGVSVVLLGDFRQLPPVGESAIYNNKGGRWVAGYNLYQHFTNTIIFTEVQRQSGDAQKKFRGQLERLGNGDFTIEDWREWTKRSLRGLAEEEQHQFEREATKACALNRDKVSFNINRIKELGQPVASIPAENDCSAAKGQRGDSESGLPGHLLLCKGAKIRLKSNLWTEAGLTNGSVGHIIAILYPIMEKPPSMPRAVIATFEGYEGPSYLTNVAKAVPILPVRRSFIIKGKTANRRHLPLQVSYAISIHGLQGATEEKVILNTGPTEFAGGLLFVGASRTKAFEDLAFDPMPNFERFQQVNRSKDIRRRKDEETRMANLEGRTYYKFGKIIRDCFRLYGKDIEGLTQDMSLPQGH